MEEGGGGGGGEKKEERGMCIGIEIGWIYIYIYIPLDCDCRHVDGTRPPSNRTCTGIEGSGEGSRREAQRGGRPKEG